MKKKPIYLLAISSVFLAMLYLAFYSVAAERSTGRARGAGMYFHYRFFTHDLLATLFLPAAWLESEIINIYPKPFLINPSWPSVPQALILQSPNWNISFSNSYSKETKGRDLQASKFIHDGKGNVMSIKR